MKKGDVAQLLHPYRTKIYETYLENAGQDIYPLSLLFIISLSH
jgi:hypothetical protein